MTKTGLITYPAQPINGGPLEKARVQYGGDWRIEPMINGIRALVHAPTLAVFDRAGERMTVNGIFEQALGRLRQLARGTEIEWFDCVALGEKQRIVTPGQLVVIDYVHARGDNYAARVDILDAMFVEFWPTQDTPPVRNVAVSDIEDALDFYKFLSAENSRFCAPFYAGIVAKRADSVYPIQRKNPDATTPTWVKHQWSF